MDDQVRLQHHTHSPPLAVLFNCESTSIPPYESVLIPAADKFSSAVLGLRPTAARYISHLISVAAFVPRSPPPLASKSNIIGALSFPRGT